MVATATTNSPAARGNDSLSGGAGADTLDGGSGNDTLSGGAGSNTLDGGEGNDSLHGGANDDLYVLDGSTADHDTIADDGGAGDTVRFENIDPAADIEAIEQDGGDLVFGYADGGSLTIKDYYGSGAIETFESPADALQMGDTGNNSLTTDGGRQVLFGDSGNDTLSAGADDDRLIGASGADSLSGGSGDDTLDGGADADVLNGDQGDDVLSGGAGSDTLDGGTENDELAGGEGNDSLSGGAGDDALAGDAGDDVMDGGAGSDALAGGAGDDVYVISGATTDHDVITDTGGSDTLRFEGIDPFAEVDQLVKSGKDLVFQFTDGGPCGSSSSSPPITRSRPWRAAGFPIRWTRPGPAPGLA